MTMRLIKILSALYALTSVATFAQQAPQDIADNWSMPYTNGIAAVVNDRIITVEDVREYMAPLIPEIRRRSRTSQEFEQQVSMLARESVRNLVDRILVIQDFRKAEFTIPEAYLEAEYQDFITEEFGGDRARFIEWLESQGKTIREFREDKKEDIIFSYMRGRLRRNTSQVSPERILEYYEDHKDQFMQQEAIRLRQIVLRPLANESKDLLLQQAESIAEQVRSGQKTFAELAKQKSQDAKAKSGGDWGWIKRGDLIPQLADVAFALEKGEVSEPIEMGENVILLYVDDLRREGAQPLSEVRPQIEEAITAQLARKAQERMLERLRKKAYIRYYLTESH